MTTTLDEFASSSNGDRWLLGSDDGQGNAFVEHRANVPSGGAVTRTGVPAFLAQQPAGPEHSALQRLIELGSAGMADLKTTATPAPAAPGPDAPERERQ